MMLYESRFQQAVRTVWERSHSEYLGWPEEKRSAVRPAGAALLAWLDQCGSETELDARYWAPGDPTGVLLRQHLPRGFDADELLTLEEACFWRRLAELRADG